MNILLLSTIGIYFSYIIMSFIDQNMIKLLEKESPQKTHIFNILACVGLLFCFVFSIIHEKVKRAKRSNNIPMKQQVWMGFLFAASMIGSTIAKANLPYFILLFMRQSRILFIIVLGVLFSRVKSGTSLKLTKQKIVTGIVITLGAIIFSLFQGDQKIKISLDDNKENQTSIDNNKDNSFSYLSYLLVIVSLICQALLSDSQAYQKKQFSATANHLMKSTSKYALLFILIFTVFGLLWQQPDLNLLGNPQLLMYIICHCLLQILGQFSIYNIVVNYKQHVFPMVSATRKIFTVVLSSMFIGDTIIQNKQYIGVIIILLGIIYEIYDEKRQNKMPTGKAAHMKEASQQKDQQQADIMIETPKVAEQKIYWHEQKLD